MPRAQRPEAGAAAEGDDTATATRVRPTSLPGKETHTADFREPALKPKDLSLDTDLDDERRDSQIAIPEQRVTNDYMSELAFMEEPVTIRIEPAGHDNAAMTVDVFCNGKGAEILDARGKWLELNILPVGIVVTTKRKYVEILARSKQMRVSTPDHGGNQNVDKNEVTRRHNRSHVFSVIKDSDRGTEWLTALLSESF